jgi:hypothetical protein
MKLPQLSLRELFLLVVIAVMGCGWWVDRRRWIKTIDELTNPIVIKDMPAKDVDPSVPQIDLSDFGERVSHKGE